MEFEPMFDSLGEAYKRGFIDGYTKFGKKTLTKEEQDEIINILTEAIFKTKQEELK